MGVFAILATPSEEEPQIVVPMVDVMVSMPGSPPKEMETRVIGPMEKLLWEIPGVEYLYSTAMEGRAMTVVRFYVGEDTEKSLVKVYDKLHSHFDWIPPGCSKPLIKAHSIDDVPILSLTLWSDGYDALQLRQMAERLNEEIRKIPGISETAIKGGLKRELRVELDPSALAALQLDAADITAVLSSQNRASWIGHITEENRKFSVRLNNFFKNREEVGKAVVKVKDGKVVTLDQVASMADGPEEPESYLFMGTAKGIREVTAEEASSDLHPGVLRPAVTIAVSKRKGWNATELAEKVLRKVEASKGYILPRGVHYEVTRNYGETAKEKADELLKHLAIATISVSILMALLLGLRASLVVLVAIPVTLALTLFIYYLYGYTLNRVTLFALIFCIGILVDDPIVGVENIVRHLQMAGNKGREIRDTIIEAVTEVGKPLILATLTVIFAILPLAFVRGLMGPYMRPMPVGASMAMLISMVISFIITPWCAYHIFKNAELAQHSKKEGWLTILYRWAMRHLIEKRRHRWFFLGTVAILFVCSCSLIYFKTVRVKMLPFDNKSEFQLIIDMPEGTALEQTAKVATALAQDLAQEETVKDFQVYIGTSAPYNFNGLVRHYYLRQGANVADIQVNLLPKKLRTEQSHEIARRLRPLLEETASAFGARIKLSEIPPGPPVLQTLVAEIYGPDYEQQISIARGIMQVFEDTPGVVDVDWYMTDPHEEYRVRIEPDKAATLGISIARVEQVLKTALQGATVQLLHDPSAIEDVPIRIRFPADDRSSEADLKSIMVRSSSGDMIPLAEIARIQLIKAAHPIYHKNLQPVVYVTGDVAGEEESPVYAILKMNRQLQKIEMPDGEEGMEIYYAKQPFMPDQWAMKWDGEWHITYEVFRDMGMAFAVVIVLIFIVVTGWFRSYSIPLVILSPIPLSLIGIIPAHAIMNSFFTATSMIGFIAGAGIVVRNSIILVDFIKLRLLQGEPVEKAVVDAGALRFRPMLLTSAAVVVGSFVILFDPIFQGLAISLMAGEIAATLFSRMVVPILFYLDYKGKEKGSIFL